MFVVIFFLAYIASALFIIRFIQAVHTWDEEIRSFAVSGQKPDVRLDRALTKKRNQSRVRSRRRSNQKISMA